MAMASPASGALRVSVRSPSLVNASVFVSPTGAAGLRRDAVGGPAASPHRTVPRCRHFGIDAVPGLGACGGCTWQHIAYAEQLRLKTAAC